MANVLVEESSLSAIADAIRAKTGGSDTYTPGQMAAAVQSIPTGGGGGTAASSKDVNFIDYDGTIRYSYTAAEFAALEELPENPSHGGLTAQGWNWSLEGAQSYVASYGKLWIGQMYITDDGATRIYIHLEEGRLEPYLGLAVNGSAAVDWGDNSTDTVTGGSLYDTTSIKHTYSDPGDYVISVSVDGSIEIDGEDGLSSLLRAGVNTSTYQSKVYANAIRRVEIGNDCNLGYRAFQDCYGLESITIPSSVTNITESAFDSCYALRSITLPKGITSIGDDAFTNCHGLVSIAIPSSVTSINVYTFGSCHGLRSITLPDGITRIGDYVFRYCYGLESITIPSSVTSIEEYAFDSCYTLRSITLPDGITGIGSRAFQDCYGLASITIPSSVTSIGDIAFSACYGLGFIRFKSTTPPTASSNAWINIPTDCIIYVPRGSLSTYTSTTNYPDSAIYTYVEY